MQSEPGSGFADMFPKNNDASFECMIAWLFKVGTSGTMSVYRVVGISQAQLSKTLGTWDLGTLGTSWICFCCTAVETWEFSMEDGSVLGHGSRSVLGRGVLPLGFVR
jgi:hypothetical protein